MELPHGSQSDDRVAAWDALAIHFLEWSQGQTDPTRFDEYRLWHRGVIEDAARILGINNPNELKDLPALPDKPRPENLPPQSRIPTFDQELILTSFELLSMEYLQWLQGKSVDDIDGWWKAYWVRQEERAGFYAGQWNLKPPRPSKLSTLKGGNAKRVANPTPNTDPDTELALAIAYNSLALDYLAWSQGQTEQSRIVEYWAWLREGIEERAFLFARTKRGRFSDFPPKAAGSPRQRPPQTVYSKLDPGFMETALKFFGVHYAKWMQGKPADKIEIWWNDLKVAVEEQARLYAANDPDLGVPPPAVFGARH